MWEQGERKRGKERGKVTRKFNIAAVMWINIPSLPPSLRPSLPPSFTHSLYRVAEQEAALQEQERSTEQLTAKLRQYEEELGEREEVIIKATQLTVLAMLFCIIWNPSSSLHIAGSSPSTSPRHFPWGSRGTEVNHWQTWGWGLGTQSWTGSKGGHQQKAKYVGFLPWSLSAQRGNYHHTHSYTYLIHIP